MGQIFSCGPCNKNKKDSEPLDFNIGVEIKQDKHENNDSDNESDIEIKLTASNEELATKTSATLDDTNETPKINNRDETKKNDEGSPVESTMSEKKLDNLANDGTTLKNSTNEEFGNKDVDMNHNSKNEEVVVTSNDKKSEASLKEISTAEIQAIETNKLVEVKSITDFEDKSSDDKEIKIEKNEAYNPGLHEPLLTNSETKQDNDSNVKSEIEILKPIGEEKDEPSTVDDDDCTTDAQSIILTSATKILKV